MKERDKYQWEEDSLIEGEYTSQILSCEEDKRWVLQMDFDRGITFECALLKMYEYLVECLEVDDPNDLINYEGPAQ